MLLNLFSRSGLYSDKTLFTCSLQLTLFDNTCIFVTNLFCHCFCNFYRTRSLYQPYMFSVCYLHSQKSSVNYISEYLQKLNSFFADRLQTYFLFSRANVQVAERMRSMAAVILPQ